MYVSSRMSEEVFEASPSITKRKWRRVHGLQWPWHPQQVVAWLILIYFTLFTFCVVIPSFNRNAAIVLTGQYTIFKHLFIAESTSVKIRNHSF